MTKKSKDSNRARNCRAPKRNAKGEAKQTHQKFFHETTELRATKCGSNRARGN